MFEIAICGLVGAICQNTFGSDAKHLKSKNTSLPEVMGLCFHSATILSILARTNTSIRTKTPKWKENLPETFDRGEEEAQVFDEFWFISIFDEFMDAKFCKIPKNCCLKSDMF